MRFIFIAYPNRTCGCVTRRRHRALMHCQIKRVPSRNITITTAPKFFLSGARRPPVEWRGNRSPPHRTPGLNGWAATQPPALLLYPLRPGRAMRLGDGPAPSSTSGATRGVVAAGRIPSGGGLRGAATGRHGPRAPQTIQGARRRARHMCGP